MGILCPFGPVRFANYAGGEKGIITDYQMILHILLSLLRVENKDETKKIISSAQEAQTHFWLYLRQV